jgi:hypothetical protein
MANDWHVIFPLLGLKLAAKPYNYFYVLICS